MNLKIAIVAIALSLNYTAPGATTAFFYEAGMAGSYIAQGSSGFIASGQGDWVLSTPLDQPYDSSIFIKLVEGNYNQYWFIHLIAPQGQTFTTGTYSANRWPFQNASKAGFDCSSGSRGLNMSTTYLEVLDFHQDPITKIVESLAFNAIQFEEIESSTNLDFSINRCSYLSYSYNSDIEISGSPSVALMAMTIPEPSSFLLAGIGVFFTLIRRRYNN